MAKKNTTERVQTTVRKEATGKPGFIEKNAMKIALLIGVIGLVIRLYRLGFLSLWVDEYMHALAAMKGQFTHGENNGILLTWMNTILSSVFGNSEFVMRFPVALLGAALIPAVYVLGRDISNYKVGLMAAVLVTVSLYLIFWSRVQRPYGMVATFYVPLLLSFWLMLERKPEKESFLGRIGIHPKYLLLVVAALILSMLSQLLCFLFFFTAGFYGTFMAIEGWITKKFSPLKFNAYNLLFYLNIIMCVFMFTTFGNKVMRPMMELFLPANIVTLILPDMKAIMATLAGDKWSVCFDTYLDVLLADFKYVYLLGWAGFVLALMKNRKTGYFLIASFVVPFFLLSFIFTSTSHAKYISFIYPVFLISAAYSLYFIAFNIVPRISKSYTETNKTYLGICTVVFLILTLSFMQRKEIKEMLVTETHGNVVDKRLAEIHFVNWKQPCEYIRDHMKPNDVVMATVKAAPRYYLNMDNDSVVWFRQMELDGKTKTYKQRKPEARKRSAATYEQFVKTYNENPRGWLLADYYFDNALTDPRAKEFAEQNFTFHFDACDDGAVKVFSWDKSKPKDYQSAFVVELGKNDNQQASQPFTVTINKAGLPPVVYLQLLTQGVDSDNEAYVIINGDKQVAITPNGRPSQIAGNKVRVDPSIFKEGQNKIQFMYNTEEGNGDETKGFVIYNFDLSN